MIYISLSIGSMILSNLSSICSSKSIIAYQSYFSIRKLLHYQQTTVTIYVRNTIGQIQKLGGIVGESLLNTLIRYKVKCFQESIICNGYDTVYQPHLRPHDYFTMEPQCGLCRIIVQDNWYDRTLSETDNLIQAQEDLLYQQIDLKSKTRLACCLPVEQWMDGIVIRVDQEPLPNQQIEPL